MIKYKAIKNVMAHTSGEFFLSLIQFSGKLLKRMDANLSIHGISFTEYQVLHQLNLAAGSTLPRIELARNVGLSASGVTRLIAPMEKLGLVQKEPHSRDARMSLVKLSKAGQTMYEDSSTTVSSVATDMLDKLTGGQKKALERLF